MVLKMRCQCPANLREAEKVMAGWSPLDFQILGKMITCENQISVTAHHAKDEHRFDVFFRRGGYAGKTISYPFWEVGNGRIVIQLPNFTPRLIEFEEPMTEDAVMTSTPSPTGRDDVMKWSYQTLGEFESLIKKWFPLFSDENFDFCQVNMIYDQTIVIFHAVSGVEETCGNSGAHFTLRIWPDGIFFYLGSPNTKEPPRESWLKLKFEP